MIEVGGKPGVVRRYGVSEARPVELRQIKYFTALADTLNFTRAAERCNVTQPALTRAINKLEQELGGALVVRARRNSRLTPLGRRLAAHFVRISEEVTQVRALTRETCEPGLHKVTIGLARSIGALPVAEFLSTFQLRNAQVQVQVDLLAPAECAAAVAKAQIDVAILPVDGALPLGMLGQRLYTERWAVAVPFGHRFSRSKGVRPAELVTEHRVDWSRSDLSPLVNHNPLLDREHWPPVASADDILVVRAMIASGVGVAILPQYALAHACVDLRPLSATVTEREVCLAYATENPLSRPTEFLVRHAAEHAWPN